VTDEEKWLIIAPSRRVRHARATPSGGVLLPTTIERTHLYKLIDKQLYWRTAAYVRQSIDEYLDINCRQIMFEQVKHFHSWHQICFAAK